MEGTRLDHATDFALPVACRTLAVGLSWQTEAGGTPLRDLNLSCLVFDEKGRFVTVVDFYNADGGDLAPGITHRRDSFFLAHGCSSTQEKVYIHLGKVPETAGVLIPMATSLSSDFRSVAKITAHAAAVAYSLIETAKLNRVDPQTWLADTIARISDCKITRVNDLLPWT